MKINLLTCTQDRPEALAVCRRYVERSFCRPDQWLIVSDGKVPVEQKDMAGVNIVCLQRERFPVEPDHTLPLNLAASIPLWEDHVGELLVFWEDDDWYAPEYLDQVKKAFTDNPNLLLYGQSFAPYYRLAAKEWAIMPNDKHSSLCATALLITPDTRRMLEFAIADVNSPFVDIRMWRWINPALAELHNLKTVVGIKQMPGIPGQTMGWKGGDMFHPDTSGLVLDSWVGAEDAAVYRRIVR